MLEGNSGVNTKDGRTLEEKIAGAKHVAECYEAQYRPQLVRVTEEYIAQLQAALKRQKEGQALSNRTEQLKPGPGFKPDVPVPSEVSPEQPLPVYEEDPLGILDDGVDF